LHIPGGNLIITFSVFLSITYYWFTYKYRYSLTEIILYKNGNIFKLYMCTGRFISLKTEITCQEGPKLHHWTRTETKRTLYKGVVKQLRKESEPEPNWNPEIAGINGRADRENPAVVIFTTPSLYSGLLLLLAKQLELGERRLPPSHLGADRKRSSREFAVAPPADH